MKRPVAHRRKLLHFLAGELAGAMELPEERRQRRILISGSAGLIGRHLVAALQGRGDLVVPLVRQRSSASTICWDPEAGTLDPHLVSGFDAVVHLAGEPVATGRWTTSKKRRIMESRVKGTVKLAAALAKADRPPPVFLCASGINYYGDRQDALLDETAAAGKGFLAEVCVAWEEATRPLETTARVAHLRIGVVLAADGGTLPMMLPLFRMGLGGWVAGGKAYMSWISIRDLVEAIDHILRCQDLHGPVNVVAPESVTGKKFSADLAAAIGRPALLPVPGWVARMLMGEMAKETVLTSVRAVPQRLMDTGFRFQDETVSEALFGCGVRR